MTLTSAMSTSSISRPLGTKALAMSLMAWIMLTSWKRRWRLCTALSAGFSEGFEKRLLRHFSSLRSEGPISCSVASPGPPCTNAQLLWTYREKTSRQGKTAALISTERSEECFLLSAIRLYNTSWTFDCYYCILVQFIACCVFQSSVLFWVNKSISSSWDQLKFYSIYSYRNHQTVLFVLQKKKKKTIKLSF